MKNVHEDPPALFMRVSLSVLSGTQEKPKTDTDKADKNRAKYKTDIGKHFFSEKNQIL